MERHILDAFVHVLEAAAAAANDIIATHEAVGAAEYRECEARANESSQYVRVALAQLERVCVNGPDVQRLVHRPELATTRVD